MSDWGLVVSAEHASHAVPDEVELGLTDAVLQSHTGWDPGVAIVARAVGRHFGVTPHLGEWTRLVADLNRPPDSPEVVAPVAFGVTVPGNGGLDAAAVEARVAKYHRPYWSAVEASVRTALSAAPRVLHLSVHSFTPVYDGTTREVELGVMMDPERPLERAVADTWIEVFARDGFVSRENEPYDGRAPALVTSLRSVFDPLAYAGVEIEISHGLLDRIDDVATAVIDAVGVTIGR